MIWNIYLKEMKDSLRDRKTLFLSVGIPILMIAGLTLFYEYILFSEKEVEVITIAVSENIEEETYQWLDSISNVKLDKANDPVQSAMEGHARVAIDFQEGYTQQMEQGISTKLTLYADQSSMKSSQAVEYLTKELSLLQQQEIKERFLQEGIDPAQMNPFEIDVQTLSKKDESSIMLLSILFSLIVVMSVMLGGFPAATDLFAGEKERKTMEALLITPVNRMKLIMAKWVTISTLGVISGGFSILAFGLITHLLTEKMASALQFEGQILSLLLSAMIGITLFSFMFATVQMMISIIAKTFKEAQNYLSPIMFLSLIPYFLLTGVVPNELTTLHFIIPFMNIYALLKELIYGIFSIQSILLVTGSSLVMVLIGFSLANWMFKKDKWVLGK